MAYDLIAKMVLKDGMSTPLKRITSTIKGVDDATKKLRKTVGGAGEGLSAAARSAGTYRDSLGRLRNAQGRFVKDTSRQTAEVKKLNNAARESKKAFDIMRSSSKSAFNGVVGGAAAVAGVIGGIKAANGLLDATIGAAATQQQQEVTVSALFKGDMKSAEKYLSVLENKAANSTLSLTELLSGAKSSVIMTKDIQQLTKLTDVAQKLAILDPEQGYEGAIYALRELNSGDGVSLTERFEIPRSVVNDIKTLPLAKQLEAVNKELDKYGITDELITKQSTTLIGQRNKALANLRKTLRDMGTKSLAPLTAVFRDVNKWLGKNSTAISKFGSDILYNLSTRLKSGFEYIQKNYLNNPEFMKLDFGDKMKKVWNDIIIGFNSWWGGGGKESVQAGANKIVKLVTDTLGSDESLKAMIGVGKKLVSAIFEGTSAQFEAFTKENPLLASLLVGVATPGPIQAKVATAGSTLLDSTVKPVADESGAWLGQKVMDIVGIDRPVGSGRSSGTPKQSIIRNSNTNVNVNMPGAIIREEADITSIADKIARALEDAEAASLNKGGPRRTP